MLLIDPLREPCLADHTFITDDILCSFQIIHGVLCENLRGSLCEAHGALPYAKPTGRV